MILKMQKLTLVGLLEEKEALLRQLMKKRCVQIQNPEDIQEYGSIKELSALGVSQTYDLEQELSKFAAAIKAVSDYVEKTSMFAKKDLIPLSALLDRENYAKAAAVRDEVNQIVKEIADLKSSKAKDSFLVSSLEPWRSLDADLSMTQTKSCGILYLSLPTTTQMEELDRQLQEATSLCYTTVVSEDTANRYLAIVYHLAAREKVLEVLKGFNTTKPDFSTFRKTAADNIATLKGQIATYDNQVEELTGRLRERAKQLSVLEMGYDMVVLQIDDQKAKEKIFHTQSVFALSGWVAENDREKLAKLLDGFQCYYQFAAPAEDEEPPIRLKNSKFARPYELITEMYSLPSYNGIDPDPMMAPFFILFFGMMLADGAYGLIIFLLCFFGLKMLKPEEGFLKNAMQIGVGCGLSTIFWGAIYGGWFGNLITQIGESWFHTTITVPALLDPLNDPMTVMILCFILGAVHLFVGMGIKAYMMIQRGDALSAVFDIGFWYILLIGLPLLVLPATATVGKYMAIGGAVGLILTQGRAEKNIIMKLLKGIMSLYDITGYLSDVLSYSRCLALGLAGGVIANVMNILGTLPGFNIIGIVAFVLVFLVGHSFNLAISGLGAYVHTSRLQYVEFFGKFYEAGGQPFTPFKANTKYTLISDKEDF